MSINSTETEDYSWNENIVTVLTHNSKGGESAWAWTNKG